MGGGGRCRRGCTARLRRTAARRQRVARGSSSTRSHLVTAAAALVPVAVRPSSGCHSRTLRREIWVCGRGCSSTHRHWRGTASRHPGCSFGCCCCLGRQLGGALRLGQGLHPCRELEVVLSRKRRSFVVGVEGLPRVTPPQAVHGPDSEPLEGRATLSTPAQQITARRLPQHRPGLANNTLIL
jgi:hypothetical protein